MTRVSLYTLSMAMAVGASSLSAQTFEGVVTVRLSSRGGAPQEAEYITRNGNVRINLATPAGPAVMIGLAAEQKLYMLLESQRMYMELPTGDLAATAKAADPKLTRTGKKETIAGYECEHLLIETTSASGVQKTDACVTSALGRFLSPAGGMGGAAPAWQRMLSSEAAFPLKVTMPDGSTALEVTKVEKKRVTDTQFRIPSEFTKMDMPRRPGGLRSR